MRLRNFAVRSTYSAKEAGMAARALHAIHVVIENAFRRGV